jgi:hypothetical protein
VGLDQFGDGLAEQRFIAESHPEAAQLLGSNLMLRSAIEVRD